MKQSWLIQRLRRPTRSPNPFAFGGGLRNGGLSDEAMSLLQRIFSFDYMGAAEFEFGAVPKAFQRLAKLAGENKLKTTELQLKPSQVHKKYRPKDAPVPKEVPTIYVLGPEEDLPEIVERIRGFAAEPYSGLKETTRLNSALMPAHEWDMDLIGWFDLDNDFMFFTDGVAFRKTCGLFGVDID